MQKREVQGLLDLACRELAASKDDKTILRGKLAAMEENIKNSVQGDNEQVQTFKVPIRLPAHVSLLSSTLCTAWQTRAGGRAIFDVVFARVSARTLGCLRVQPDVS